MVFASRSQLDIDSAEPPAPGSFEHAVLVGKLAFFTALGIPDNDIFGTPIRDFVPRNFKGKMSKDAWSSCGSCHPDGLADGVTWSFGTGPRQTIPLDGMFSKQSPDDQRVLNWSAVRGSNTDFNANSRVTQGGCGFASDDFDPGQCFAKGNTTLANPAIYDHGITHGGSDALDAQTLVDLRRRAAATPAAARCERRWRLVGTSLRPIAHPATAGAKWTKSEIFHRDNPAAVAQNGAPLDPGVTRLPVTINVPGAPANEFKSFTCNDADLQLSRRCGDVRCQQSPGDPGQRRGQHGVWGEWIATAVVVQYQLPRAVPAPRPGPDPGGCLPAAWVGTGSDSAGDTIQTELTALERANLLAFLRSIDGTTASIPLRRRHLQGPAEDGGPVSVAYAHVAVVSTQVARKAQGRPQGRPCDARLISGLGGFRLHRAYGDHLVRPSRRFSLCHRLSALPAQSSCSARISSQLESLYPLS